MKTKSVCWINVVSLFCLIAMGSQAMALDLSSPRATVHSFVGSLNQYNFKQAAMCVDGAKDEMSAAAIAIGDDWKKEQLDLSISDLQSSIDKARATVTVNVTVRAKGKEKVLAAQQSHLAMSQQSGSWKIVTDDSSSLVESDVLEFMAAVLKSSEESQKIFETARANAQLNSCQSNLKQLSQALQTLIKDHDNTFALTNSTLHQELQAYVRSDALYYCPVVSGDDEKEPSYSFNDNLANMTQAAIKNPATTIMLYEGKDGKLDFRHNGKANVAFADGHVKAVDAEAAKSLLWQP